MVAMAGIVVAWAPLLGAQEATDARSATATVFARYAPRILKVQVVEVGSAAKVSTGTAFVVGADGRLLTNYHVIAEWIHEPENHRIELLAGEGAAIVAEVLTVDVIADLAVLKAPLQSPEYFELGPVTLRQGDRLYSLGHPGDLGLSIVEGTYNGLLPHTLYPKVHFTGSINPGMSGGPTITESGRVVGVNVSTMGNQRSFLVPQARAAALVARTRVAEFAPPERFLDLIAGQLRDFQEEYLANLFAGDVPQVEVGPFRVATEPSPIFRCWGNADRDPEKLVETLEHSCTTDDYVYIASGQRSGILSLDHTVLRSTGLSPRRFASYVEAIFGLDQTPGGSEKHVTPWSCTVRNVRVAANTMRVSYCVRRLKKLGALYDAVVTAAVLGRGTDALVSTLRLNGVSSANAESLSTRWLELIGWR
jgi:serine protease Do